MKPIVVDAAPDPVPGMKPIVVDAAPEPVPAMKPNAEVVTPNVRGTPALPGTVSQIKVPVPRFPAQPGDPNFVGPLPKAEILGPIQKNTGFPHKVTQETLSEMLAESLNYRKVYRTTKLSEISGQTHEPDVIPDVVGERWDGTLDLFEIRSPRQTVKELRAKMETAREQLRPNQRGHILVVEPPNNANGEIK
jgi:hypothetical protein